MITMNCVNFIVPNGPDCAFKWKIYGKDASLKSPKKEEKHKNNLISSSAVTSSSSLRMDTPNTKKKIPQHPVRIQIKVPLILHAPKRI